MENNWKALAVALAISIVVLALFSRTARETTDRVDFNRRAMLWAALTLVGFLTPSFWFYALPTALMMLFFAPQDGNRVAFYLFLIFALPPIPMQIPGFGAINYLFAVDHLRLLALTVLLPAALLPPADSRSDARLGRSGLDRILLAYIVYLFLLQVVYTTPTDAARQGFYYFIDIFLPYYAVGRMTGSVEKIRGSATMLVAAACVLAAMAIFEATRHWLLYANLTGSWEANWGFGRYLPRNETIRAMATTGHSIALGYVLVVALAFGSYLFLRSPADTRSRWMPWLLLITAGLIATLSRGPWVGAAILVAAFFATAPRIRARHVLTVGALAGLGGLVLLTPLGEIVIDYLPFVGSVDTENVTYRQRLVEISLMIIQEYPLFGIPFFLSLPEMQSLRQGQGIIDIVNSYIGLALSSGLIGLGLFASFFALLAFGILRVSRRLAEVDSELHLLGRMLFAVVVSILVMIATVSSVTVIPVLYWSIAGMGASYIAIARRRLEQTETEAQPAFPVGGESGLEHA